MLLFGKNRSRGVNFTKGMHKLEIRVAQAEAERRKAKALIDTCLAPGVTVDSLVADVQSFHKVPTMGVNGVAGAVTAIRTQVAVWVLLQHAYNTDKVRQQRRRLDKLKRNVEQRVARMISVKLPEMVQQVEQEFAAAVHARLVASGLDDNATDAQMSDAIDAAIRDGVHLTRAVKMVPRSPASRAAERKGSLRKEWGNGNRRPQVDQGMLKRSDVSSKVHVSMRV